MDDDGHASYRVRVVQAEGKHLDEANDILDRMMVAAKLDMKKALDGLAVIADGVEDPQRAAVLAAFTSFVETPLKSSVEAAARVKAARTVIHDFVGTEPDAYAAELTRRVAVYEAKAATRAQTHAQYEARKKDMLSILTAALDEDAVVARDTRGKQAFMRCIITQKPMENPMRSKLCAHVYSAEGILGLLAQGKGKTKCPNPGCKHVLEKKDLEADTETEVKLENFKLTQGAASAAAGSHDTDEED